eukprot:NODE_2553_length_1170_cov_29.066905_g2334_i0.p1 GENE.NODE_2553_length_1170_cov_29.066905_g2334_i0~~NODE_2553_length_1170_cov_29.066905_g2334_i0.p1  ORF type:complete len:290 (+),score=54.63 NODE_2553_length_1170_cov_29.066905_g2334_i0:149-1018(+)
MSKRKFSEAGDLVAVDLSSLKFSSPLEGMDNAPRVECPKCGRRRKYYCYDCLCPVHPTLHPTDIRLPLRLSIIKHFNERNGKSTAIHAAVMCQNAELFEFPSQSPTSLDPKRTLVIYPTDDAALLSEIPNLRDYTDVVVVEATWQQSRSIASSDALRSMKKVRLANHKSVFWRYQSKADDFLATIEAIYFFYLEYQNALAGLVDSDAAPYSGELDDLLFFYAHMYRTIQEHYRSNPSKRFTTRAGRPDYIKYDEGTSSANDAVPGGDPSSVHSAGEERNCSDADGAVKD